MKEFVIGLLFLIAVAVLIGLWFLFYPLLMLLGMLLRLCVIFILALAAIWLLGKGIVCIWGKLKV